MKKKLEFKIKELFKYRKLPQILKLVETSKKKESDFYDKLIKLQAAIYDLDIYLESNWELEDESLGKKWEPIYEALADLGVAKAKQPHYVRQILKYQSHEMNLRKQKYPTQYKMEYFYYYKSCDVKLIRQLIYDKFPELHKMIKFSDWRIFDLVTEIVDDLTDIVEDTAVFNGNRFLISTILQGKKKSFGEFDLFLNEMDKRIEGKNWDEGKYKKLKKWTETVVKEADDILDELASSFSNITAPNSIHI